MYASMFCLLKLDFFLSEIFSPAAPFNFYKKGKKNHQNILKQKDITLRDLKGL